MHDANTEHVLVDFFFVFYCQVFCFNNNIFNVKSQTNSWNCSSEKCGFSPWKIFVIFFSFSNEFSLFPSYLLFSYFASIDMWFEDRFERKFEAGIKCFEIFCFVKMVLRNCGASQVGLDFLYFNFLLTYIELEVSRFYILKTGSLLMHSNHCR